jgi:hydrogenase-4 transcriptional activator
MNKRSLSANTHSKSEKAPSNGAGGGVHQNKLKSISPEKLDALFSSVGQKLREGFSSQAEEILTGTIESHHHTPDNLANLKRLLSFTLETVGRYQEALDILTPYEDADTLDPLSRETQVRVKTQLAIAYNNLNDQPKAVTLLKEMLTTAEKNTLHHLSGSIDSALARVYRKLNEYPIARDYAQKSLNYFRENGDWLGMAEAYREIALSYHHEGNSEKALENFELGIQIIGGHSAPFMLGKIYTDMSGAHWFLRRPQEGIESLEKSIKFFDQTEHILNSVIAYNNLGINLMLIGEWTKAEEMIKRALDLAVSKNHVHIAGILDSLGELKILRGDFDQAQEYLEQAVAFAEERKREWYAIQAMRNLARCFLAQGKIKEAENKARETIGLCKTSGHKNIGDMAGLVLAESYLLQGRETDCENYLQEIEDDDPSSDFFILGNIQRIRGLAALQEDDRELAVHHFNRSLTIFEAAEDLYHTALANFLIGSNLADEHSERAIRHLSAAGEIFKKLGVEHYKNAAAKKTAEITKRIESQPAAEIRTKARPSTVVSQLLTVRLAEATATRELLFRELVAVLQQESRARKIIIAEANDQKRLYPFITHGYAPDESADLIEKFNTAHLKNEDRTFARTKNLSITHLRPSNAPHAYLIISPGSGAILNDEGSLQPLIRVVELGLDVISLREKDKSAPVEHETSPYTSQSLMPGFIHSSPAMTALVEEVYKIRSSDVTVLVTGESGTGKELVSRAIHTISNRKDKVFVPFNCTAVPKELAEGHLFGYRKGAFTGAVTDSPGMIRSADGGTLFLDEIGDLPLDVQPKLLRFLQEGEIQPIGEKTPIKVDVRVIAATNMPLEDKVAEGSFREDLYYRLNVIRLRVAPLRERRSEIPPMVNYYINHYSSRFSKKGITITPQTIDLLMVCNWEGNVRQLANEIQRIIARAVDNEIITPESLSPELKRSVKPLTPFEESGNVRPIASYNSVFSPFTAGGAPGGTLEEAVNELEMQMIKGSLARNNWNISKVAKELGLTRRGLYLKLGRYHIEKSA